MDNLESLLRQQIASNKELMEEFRLMRQDMKDSSSTFIDSVSATKLMNSKSPNILRKLRDSGLLQLEVDYVPSAGFMYNKARLLEIRNKIVRGELTIVKIQEA